MGTTDNTGTLQVTDQWLSDFAKNNLEAFMTAIKADPGWLAMQGFRDAVTAHGDKGVYYELMAGNPKPWAAAASVQKALKDFCTALDKQWAGFSDGMDKLRYELENVEMLLSNGASDAVSVAQMQGLLTDIVSALNGGGGK